MTARPSGEMCGASPAATSLRAPLPSSFAIHTDRCVALRAYTIDAWAGAVGIRTAAMGRRRARVARA
jgi:hypothetical protein